MPYTGNVEQLISQAVDIISAEKMNFNEKLIQNGNEVLNIIDTHPHFAGVRSGEIVPVLIKSNNYGGFVTQGNTCQLATQAISDDWSEVKWDLGKIAGENTLCVDTLTNQFKAFFNVWSKMDEDDVNLEVVQYFKDIFQKTLLNAILRVGYLGDKDSTSDLINATDGFIKQMKAKAAADTDKHLVEIIENTANTVAGQTITNGQRVYDLVLEMQEKASSIPGFDHSKGVLRMNRSLAQLFVNFLNRQNDLSQYNCNCVDPSKVVNSRFYTIDNIAILGYQVEVIDFEDMFQAVGGDLYDVADGYANKNVIILAERENMALGFELEETLNKTKLFYAERENEIVFQGAALFGAGVPTDKFVIAI